MVERTSITCTMGRCRWYSRCMREPTKFQCPNCGAEYKVVRVEAAATNDLDAAIQSATDSNRHAVRRHQTEEFSRLKYAALRCSDPLATLKRKRKSFRAGLSRRSMLQPQAPRFCQTIESPFWPLRSFVPADRITTMIEVAACLCAFPWSARSLSNMSGLPGSGHSGQRATRLLTFGWTSDPNGALLWATGSVGRCFRTGPRG